MATFVLQNTPSALPHSGNSADKKRVFDAEEGPSSGSSELNIGLSEAALRSASANPPLRPHATARPSILPTSTREVSQAAHSPTSNMTTSLATAPTGPSCNLYSVPPRPKPGRKPALDKPSEKRKAQNREAQRAFRERKVAHTEELKKDINELKQIYYEVLAENGSLKTKIQEMEESHRHVEEQTQERDRLITQLQEEISKYRQREQEWSNLKQMQEEMRQRMQRHEDALKLFNSQAGSVKRPSSAGYHQLANDMAMTSLQQRSPITPPQHSPMQEASCGDCAQTGYCKCVEDFTVDPATLPPLATALNVTAGPTARQNPPEPWAELEQDFTTQTTGGSTADRLKRSSSGTKVIHQPGCGFCDDSTDCPCNPQKPAPRNASAPQPPPNPMEISSIVEPGTCVKCQTDPEQRRFCIEVSKSRQVSNEPQSHPAKRPRLEDGRPRTLTCNELYQASKHVVAESRRSGKSKAPEIESMFNSYARTVLNSGKPSDSSEARPGMRYRSFSTMEIDSAEALAALHKSRSS